MRMHKQLAIKNIVYLFLATSFMGCRIASEGVRSTLEMPASYGGTKPDSSSIASEPWSTFYKDTCLVNYIEFALKNNRDIHIATNQVNLSGADLRMVKKNFLPSVSGRVSNSVTKFGEYTMDGIGNDDTNRSESLPADKRLPYPYTEWFAGAAFDWEIDIWKKLSSRRKAAVSRYMASQEFRHGTISWLISDVAANYYELLGLDQEQRVLEQNLQLQKLALELINVQKTGGKVNQLAVDQFEAQMLNTQTQLVEVMQRVKLSEATMNELLGKFPAPLSRYTITQYDTIYRTMAGKPGDILKNRPDIRKAELELRASHADVAAARAAFYPSLTVSGGAGFSAFNLSKWFITPGAAVYSFASSLAAPIFQGGQIRALYASANARQHIALANYEKTLIGAYYEVYNTLTIVNSLAWQIEVKSQEVDVLRRAYNNSNDLFSVGYATYLEVITAQRRMLEAEIELTKLRKEKLKAISTLYRALGGGWNS